MIRDVAKWVAGHVCWVGCMVKWRVNEGKWVVKRVVKWMVGLWLQGSFFSTMPFGMASNRHLFWDGENYHQPLVVMELLMELLGDPS